MYTPVVIVSRHPGAVQWLREDHASLLREDYKVIPQVDDPSLLGAAKCIGNLPMHLAARCLEYYAIEFRGAPPRGTECSAEDMRAAGACLRKYRVEEVV